MWNFFWNDSLRTYSAALLPWFSKPFLKGFLKDSFLKGKMSAPSRF